MDSHAVYCTQCGVDIWCGNICFACESDGVKGHLCPNCGACVADELTPEQEDMLAAMGYEHPPQVTAEEAEWENKAALVEEAVLDAQGLSAAVHDLMDMCIGDRGMLLNLNRAISAFLAEFDPDMDDGRSLEDLS